MIRKHPANCFLLFNPVFKSGLALVLLVASLLSSAQDAPFVEVDFPETEAIPGQPLTLRITVLVPTFMPKPIVFPSLESPDIRVRLPEGATSPTSRRIGITTWAGVSRRYLLTPLVPGNFSLSGHTLLVTYASETDRSPVEIELALPDITFSGLIPEGAESLDPFIAANNITLTQEFKGEPLNMKPGDSLEWTVTAIIEGASPYSLPALLPENEPEGFAAYPKAPVLEESDVRGTLTGERRETVIYMAETGSQVQIPGVTLDWYNLETGTVETTTLEGFSLSVDAPVPATDTSRNVFRHWPLILASIAGVVALGFLYHFFSPGIAHALADRKLQYLASEEWAFSVLMKTLGNKQVPQFLDAFHLWAERWQGSDPRSIPQIRNNIEALCRSQYGETGTVGPQWQALAHDLKALRKKAVHSAKTPHALPSLNPR